MEKKSLQKCYENYFGSGNPDSNLWIVAFESGGDILKGDQVEFMTHLENDNDDEFIEYLNKPFDDE
ncbi:MAG: hypothetical protein ABI550_07720, partial [Ignavibacteriaceae bacterium]